MSRNVDNLIKLCSFFTEATIETDMAKRIMLSIIPSLMSKDEMYYYKGADYKALKAAIQGAKDLIKYGTKACVTEMSYYGEAYSEANTHEIKKQARKLANEGKYKECLQVCIKAFYDLKKWQSAYGRQAWGKIADTLYAMCQKLDVLELINKKRFEVKNAFILRILKKYGVPKQVQCVNSKGTKGQLINGKIYTVIGEDGGKYQLAGMEGSWEKHRFKAVEDKKLPKVKCMSPTEGLTKNKIYEVKHEYFQPDASGGKTYYKLVNDHGKTEDYLSTRFEKVKGEPEKTDLPETPSEKLTKMLDKLTKKDEDKPPFKVKCIDNAFTGHALQKGEIYEVVKVQEEKNGKKIYFLKGKTQPYSADRFTKIEEPKILFNVKCIDDSGWAVDKLKKNSVYSVIEVHENQIGYKFYTLDGVTGLQFNANRFEKIEKGNEQTIFQVKCVQNSGWAKDKLEVGKVYDVVEVEQYPAGGGEVYHLKGFDEPFESKRFKKISTEPEGEEQKPIPTAHVTPKPPFKVKALKDTSLINKDNLYNVINTKIQNGQNYYLIEIFNENEDYEIIWYKADLFEILPEEEKISTKKKLVKCINNEGFAKDKLEIGKTYEVAVEGQDGEYQYYLLVGFGQDRFNQTRFEKVNESGKIIEKAPEEKTPEVFGKTPQEIEQEETISKMDNNALTDLELETMREIVVLMNVFDGLAHNTANVMPKVVEEEVTDWRKQKGISSEESEAFSEPALRKYRARIKDLMDSKELDDPMSVYKHIRNIIERPENKYIYRDWITKIHNTPEFHKAKHMSENKRELETIKMKKAIYERWTHVEKNVSELSDLKDKIINTHNPTEVKNLIGKINQAIYKIRDSIHSISYTLMDFKHEYASIHDRIDYILDHLTQEKVFDPLDMIKERYNLYANKIPDVQTVISDVHNVKNIIAGCAKEIETSFSITAI